MGFLWFFLGMLTGIFWGIMMMCLFRADRCDYYEKSFEKNEEKEKKD